MSDNKVLAVATAAAGVGAAVAWFLATRPYKVPKVWLWKPQGGKFGDINRPTAGARTEKVLPAGKHDIQLHSLATPNGVKVTIMLEELVDMLPDFDYDAYPINIMKQDQFTSGFVEINPNSKIPAMFDKSNGTRIFESGSILLYLAEKYDTEGKLLPKDFKKRTEVMNWLFWQMGSAPYIGNYGHFFSYAPVKIKYGIDRFTMEFKRLMDVLDKQLEKNKYVCGDEYTLADIAIYPWMGRIFEGKMYGDSVKFLCLNEYKNVKRWAEELSKRPAVQRGAIVNKGWGDGKQLPERHSREDFSKL